MDREKFLANKIIKDRDSYYDWAARPATIQRIDTLCLAWHQHLNSSSLNLLLTGENIAYYLEKNKYKRFSLDLRDKLKSPAFVVSHLQHYQEVRRDLIAIGKEAVKIPVQADSLLKLFIDYQKTMIAFSYYFVSSFSVDDYIFPDFTKRLKNLLKPALTQDLLNIISSPSQVFFYQRYQRALLRAKTERDISKVVKDFFWITEYSFKEKLLTEKMAKEARHKILLGNLRDDVNSAIKNNLRNHRQIENKLLIIKDKPLRALAKLINDYINIKTDRIEVYKMFQANFRHFFYKFLLLVKLGMPSATYEEIISLTDREIENYLVNGVLYNQKKAKQRFKNKYVAVSLRGNLEFIYDKNLIAKVRKRFLQTNVSAEIIGKAVSSGQARGRVMIIKTKKDLSLFKKGSILVSNFTTPDYVSAMKLAVGIITDDGGITSHAAIIARELRKPCVVGTKVATRVLKNGDLVEVDAGRGIVKILKK